MNSVMYFTKVVWAFIDNKVIKLRIGFYPYLSATEGIVLKFFYEAKTQALSFIGKNSSNMLVF